MSPTEKQALSSESPPATGACEFALGRTQTPVRARYRYRYRSRSADSAPDPGPITNQGGRRRTVSIEKPRLGDSDDHGQVFGIGGCNIRAPSNSNGIWLQSCRWKVAAKVLATRRAGHWQFELGAGGFAARAQARAVMNQVLDGA